MASVELSQIRKVYDQTVEIIKGADLAIHDGEFLVLVGPSGCGKSTLLRMVAGLEAITAGTLSIGERVVNDVPPRDRGVAMVFQSYALYPHMTVRENMEFGLKIRKEPRQIIDQRVGDAARLLDIEPLLDRRPKQLSGGQRQRVAIGRAIVRQPDVFLFDEPLSNLDAALRTQMRVELKKLHRRLGTTMLYVTHDQVEAMTLADRIAIIRDGVIQQVGPPSEVYDRPVNRFVASFIGSPSMNFLPADHDSSASVLKAPGVRIPLPDPGREIVEFGIRPQHLEIASEGIDESERGIIEIVAEVVEPMGWEVYVHSHIGDAPFVAHVRSDEIGAVDSGDTLRFTVDTRHVHLFDEDGKTVPVS